VSLFICSPKAIDFYRGNNPNFELKELARAACPSIYVLSSMRECIMV